MTWHRGLIVGTTAAFLLAALELSAGTTVQTVPAPSPVKGGGGAQPQTQPGQPGQQRQTRRYHHQPKLKPGNTPSGSKSKKQDDQEVAIAGRIALDAAASPGEDDTFTITDSEGKGYALKGRESSLKKLVGKDVEIEGEVETKDGRTALKIKSLREVKEAKGGGKK